MPQQLSELEIGEVSLVDAPANSSTDPLTGRKTPHARVALYKRDTSDETPEVSKGDVTPMTLQEIEKKLGDQEVTLTTLNTTVTKLNAENEVLKKERELVLKMTKKERRAYASMSPAEQKTFTEADAETRTRMCNSALGKLREKAAEDGMDKAQKAEYEAAGPVRKAQILADVIKAQDEAEAKAIAKGAAVPVDKKKAADGEDDEEGDETDEDMEDKKDKKKTDTAKSDATAVELKSTQKQLADTMDRLTKAEAQLTEVQKRGNLEYFTKKASELLPHSAGSDVEKGNYLMELARATGGENSPIYKQTLDNLVAADKSLTLHYAEVGKAGNEGAVPAEKVFLAKADEIAKRDKISQPKAIEKAMMEHPELYLHYEQEHRRQVRSIV